MGEIFKISRGNRSNGCPRRGRNPASAFAARRAFHSHRAIGPVFGGVSGRREPRPPQQVVSSRHEVTPGLRPFYSPIPAPSKPAHRLDPAKDFLHALADLQTDLVTPLRRGAPVQSGHLHFSFARHVGRDCPCPAALPKTFLVTALVRPERLDLHVTIQLPVSVGRLSRHHRFAFGNRIVQGEVRAQAVPVFHQGVRAETQPGLLPAGFPIPHAVGIGRALVRVVAPRFPAKINRGIAGVFVLGRRHPGLIRAVFTDEALQTGPGFDQGAVGGEGFVARPAFLPREVIDFGEEQFRHVGGEHPLVVLGKDAVVETACGELAVQKPEPEQMVAELFAKKPFTADAVKGGEHAGLEPWFGRNAAATIRSIEFIKQWGEFFQDGIHLALDGAERMVCGHTLVEVDDRQKVRLGLRFSTHALSDTTHSKKFQRKIVFQQTANFCFSPLPCVCPGCDLAG